MNPPLMDSERARGAAYREAHRCPECRRVTDSKTRPGNEHWPYCSEAPIEKQIRYARAKGGAP